jgi:hypothetical protein
MTRTTLALLMVAGATLISAQPGAPATTLPLTLDNLTLIGVKAESVRYRDRMAIRLIEVDDKRQGGLAILKGSSFRDGVIDADVAGRRGPYAVPDDRGFVGLAFRSSADGKQHEAIYLRPDNGRAEDQLRRNHSVQYVSEPGFPWPRLRKEFPEKYESYVDLEPGAWTHLRISVSGAAARLFVHQNAQPNLIVSDLKQEVREGAIALWIGAGTEAWFSNLQVAKPTP